MRDKGLSELTWIWLTWLWWCEIVCCGRESEKQVGCVGYDGC
jgi:hypothetical protein